MKETLTIFVFAAFTCLTLFAEGRSQPFLGVDFVRWDGMPCERMGWRRPYEEHNAASYASRKEWEDETLARLKSWGFNMLGANCDDSLRHRGLSHTIFLNMSEGFCTGDDDRWISRYANVPNTALPNVFHPDFAAHCDTVAREMCAANRGDADLLGYYVDNELVWQGNRGAPLDSGLFDTVRGKRERHSARLALLAFLRKKGVADFAAFDALPPERRKHLKTAFTEFFAERYFSVTTGAIRRHDPSHLVLGCRFAGMDGAPPEVWKMAGRFCDVITFNCYPWADLDRNVVLDARGGVPVAKRFAAIHELTGRPLLVSEWSFPALDAGCPCRNGAGQRFRTQAERVQASELFARTMLAQPFVLGYSFFMWIDQPALGTNGANPEDSNYGLVSEKGVPYAGLTDMFRRLHSEVRDGSSRPKMPEECFANPLPTRSMRDKFLAEADGDASNVRFSRNGDEWRLSNSSGLTLCGKIGGKDMVGEVRLGQCLFGRYGGMIQMVTQGGDSRWILANDVKSVAFEREGVCSTLIIVAAGKEDEYSFNLTHRVTVAPGKSRFLCEVAGIENTCNLAFAVRRFYMCPFAAEARPAVRKGVQNVWKGTRECYWQMSDGRSYGMASTDDTADWFNLWLDSDGRQHPDIDFSLQSPPHLAPGKSQSPPRPMSAIASVDGST